MNSWIKIYTIIKKVFCWPKKWVNVLFGPDASLSITCTVKAQHGTNTGWIPTSALSRASPASLALKKPKEWNRNLVPYRVGKYTGKPCTIAGSMKESQQQGKGVCPLPQGKWMVYTRKTTAPPSPRRDNRHRRCILGVPTSSQASGPE